MQNAKAGLCLQFEVHSGNTKLPFSERTPRTARSAFMPPPKRPHRTDGAHLHPSLWPSNCRLSLLHGLRPLKPPRHGSLEFYPGYVVVKVYSVFNHGHMRRDFTYIDDIIAGGKPPFFQSGLEPWEVLNLGNHNPKS